METSPLSTPVPELFTDGFWTETNYITKQFFLKRFLPQLELCFLPQTHRAHISVPVTTDEALSP